MTHYVYIPYAFWWQKYLKQIGADLLVGAVPGQLLGQLRDPLAGVGQRLSARYQLPLCTFSTADQLAGIKGCQMNVRI